MTFSSVSDFYFLEQKAGYFVVTESPAIRSYHQATRTPFAKLVGDTTTIGAILKGHNIQEQ